MKSPRSKRAKRVPSPSRVARHILEERDGWPSPSPLRVLVRSLRGQPVRQGDDPESKRADADRIGSEAGRRAVLLGPSDTPAPGLLALAAHTRRRIFDRTAVHAAPIARRGAAYTAARALLALVTEQRATAEAHVGIDPTSGELLRPRVGTHLTHPAVRVGLLALFPLFEALLTLPTLEAVQLSDLALWLACIGIGLILVALAEGVAASLAHFGEREREYRVITLVLVVAAVVCALWAAERLALARDHNQAIVTAIEHNDNGAGASSAGFVGLTGGQATSGSGTVSKDLAAAIANHNAVEANAAPDLTWTFPLQLAAFLGAVLLSLRVNLAAEFWAARRAAVHQQRAQALVARREQQLILELRRITAVVRAEVETLDALYWRAAERHDEQFSHGHPSALALPERPDIEQLVNAIARPPVLDPDHWAPAVEEAGQAIRGERRRSAPDVASAGRSSGEGGPQRGDTEPVTNRSADQRVATRDPAERADTHSADSTAAAGGAAEAGQPQTPEDSSTVLDGARTAAEMSARLQGLGRERRRAGVPTIGDESRSASELTHESPSTDDADASSGRRGPSELD